MKSLNLLSCFVGFAVSQRRNPRSGEIMPPLRGSSASVEQGEIFEYLNI